MSTKSAPKASVSTEIILGTAVNDMKKAHASMEETFKKFQGLEEQAELLQAKIAQSEQKIEDLDVEYEEKLRSKKVQLELDFKSCQETVVDTYLTSQNKISIKFTDWQDLNKELNDLRQNCASELTKGLEAQKTLLDQQHANDKSIWEANQKANEAQTKAELSQKDAQIVFLTAQVKTFKELLDNEREAGIKRAEAATPQFHMPAASKS